MRMILVALLVPLLVLSSAGHTSGTIVTSCKACHEQAVCCTSPTAGDITCTCKKGFSGDGLICLPGHTAANDHHAPRRVRRSYPTSNTNLAHVRFRCGFYECTDGEDCITVDGIQQCANPCKSYTVLNDPWRSTNNNEGEKHCDRYVHWNGYYRMFIGNQSVSMPDKCVDLFKCGTQAPLWLAFPPPQQVDEIVQSAVCASFRGDCCWVQSQPIHVKACPGNYFVYKFVMPPGCYFAYCAYVTAPTTKPKPVTTTTTTTKAPVIVTMTTKAPSGGVLREHRWGSLGGVRGQISLFCCDLRWCVGRAWYRWVSTGLTWRPLVWTPPPQTWPTPGVTLTKSVTAWYGTRWSARRAPAETLWSLFIYHIPDVSFTRPVSVPFSCAYPLESETSLDVVIKPYLSLKDSKVGKGSKVGSNMTLYHSDNFTKAYPAGGVSLPVGSTLHVGVSVEESETERFVVVLEDCYATQSPDPEDIMRYYVIQNKCPTEFRQVRVEESGSSLRARFSALLFLYHGDYRDVFLHCRLSLCDQRSSSCTPVMTTPLHYRCQLSPDTN
uniref:ZP domain-containing protein n=1 Tax=Hucho hucho TaxID=62062 RepID=A0A4W5PWV7_9TELE